MRDFGPVSIKMAKAQDLSLNPSKLAGMCGRLKCCLRYEYDTYLSLRRSLPKQGKKVRTVKGDGIVLRQILLKQAILLEREEDGEVVECTLDEIVERRPDPSAESPPSETRDETKRREPRRRRGPRSPKGQTKRRSPEKESGNTTRERGTESSSSDKPETDD